MEEGEEGTDMYFIVRGELEVETREGRHFRFLARKYRKYPEVRTRVEAKARARAARTRGDSGHA